MVELLVTKLLDWPFLLFIALIIGLVAFKEKLQELEIGKSGIRFKIGIKDVTIDQLDKVITERLQELQEEIETLKSKQLVEIEELAKDEDEIEGIPRGLYELMEERIYPMLRSELWLARYVSTISRKISVSEDLVRKFCEHQPDIVVYMSGGRLAAGLSERLGKGGYQKFKDAKKVRSNVDIS